MDDNKNELDELIIPEDKDTCVVINKSEFSKEGYTQLNTILSKRALVITCVSLIALVALDILLLFEQKWASAIVVAVAVVLYPILLYVLIKHSINKSFEKYEKIMGGAKYEYDFGEKEINIIFTSAKSNISNFKLPYTGIYKVIENNSFIFIFVNSNSSYIIDKKGFEEPNDAIKARELIQKHNIKYRIVNK